LIKTVLTFLVIGHSTRTVNSCYNV